MTAAVSLAVPATTTSATEYFDVLNEIGAKTGIVKARNHVHRDGNKMHTSPGNLQHGTTTRVSKMRFQAIAQETGTGLCMFGYTSKALGVCLFRSELHARILGPICGTYQQQGMVSPACP